MKRTAILILGLAIALMGGDSINAKVKKSRNKTKTTAKTSKTRPVYYLVLGSYDNLDEARKALAQDDMPFNPSPKIYKAKTGGKTVYRICDKISYTPFEADSKDTWVWKSNGLAKCVYRPYSNGTPVPITPHEWDYWDP